MLTCLLMYSAGNQTQGLVYARQACHSWAIPKPKARPECLLNVCFPYRASSPGLPPPHYKKEWCLLEMLVVTQYMLLQEPFYTPVYFQRGVWDFRWSYSFLPFFFKLKQHIWTECIVWVLELTEEQPLLLNVEPTDFWHWKVLLFSSGKFLKYSKKPCNTSQFFSPKTLVLI